MRGTHQHSDDGDQKHDLHQTVEDEEKTSDHVGDRPRFSGAIEMSDSGGMALECGATQTALGNDL